MKLIFLLLVALLSFSALVSCETAYFAFRTNGEHDDFVFQLNDPQKIQHARDILSGKITTDVHVLGRIVKSIKEYNPKWEFHYDPDTVSFFDMAIEVCDASVSYVNDHLDEACGAFLPGCYYCPWSSKLTREIKVNYV